MMLQFKANDFTLRILICDSCMTSPSLDLSTTYFANI